MGLPSGYKRLQYIQSTGTQYVKTGFVPNQDTRIVYDCYRETASAADHFFGVRTGNTTTNAFNFYIYNSGWRSGYNSTTTSVNGPSTGRYLIDKDKNVTYINGETLGTATYASFTSGGEAYLFATFFTDSYSVCNAECWKWYCVRLSQALFLSNLRQWYAGS